MHSYPQTESELLDRAHALIGLTLGELATKARISVPTSSLKGKGWSGLFMELLLGATAGSLPEPDFQHLGIELKTIPVDITGKPLESTYISIVPLTRFVGLQWEQSEVYHKLRRILWLPLLAGKTIPLADRQVGQAFLWSPDVEQESVLRQDWQELMDVVALGELESLSAHRGSYLQVRPKGANSHARCAGVDSEGNRVQVLPRGFYLRTSFTKQILSRYL